MKKLAERIPERYQEIKAEPPKYKEYRIVSPVEGKKVCFVLDQAYKVKLDDYLWSLPGSVKWKFPGGDVENADCFVILFYSSDTSENEIQVINNKVIEKVCELLDEQYLAVF